MTEGLLGREGAFALGRSCQSRQRISLSGTSWET
jgi:hypothetical protein